MKLLGIVVTIATLASLLVGLTAAPASAAPGTLKYDLIGTPSLVNHVLVEGMDINLLGTNIDGSVVFAYDNSGALYKSTDGGVTFADPVTATVPAGAIAMAVSPAFNTDKTIVLATQTSIYRSGDGGATFYSITPAIGGGTNYITSVDVGYYYQDNVLSVIFGVADLTDDVTGLVSNVWRIRLDQGTASFVGKAGDYMTDSVLAVKFSPNHTSDAEIVCVYTNFAGDVGVASRFGELGWHETATPALVFLTGATADTTITGANIAFPSNYKGNQGNSFVISLNNTLGTVNAGVWRVTGRHAGTGSAAQKYTGNTNSLAVTDSLAAVYIGRLNGTVAKSVNISATTPDWTDGANLTGPTNASVVVKGSKVFVGTTGIESALSLSTDGGANFVQLSLMDVQTASNLNLDGLQVVDNNTMFLLMYNTSLNGYWYVFKTTDGAATWQRITTISTSVNTIGVFFAVSPAFATDQTIAYAKTDDTAVWISANGGKSFDSSFTGANVSALAISAKGDVFTGGAAAFYMVGRYSNATGLAGNVISIAISPKDSNKIAVGNDNGKVFASTDGGNAFTEVKKAAGGSFGGAETIHVSYAPDGTLYAVGTGTTGCYGYIAADWQSAAPVTDGWSVVVANDGTLYASDWVAGNGIMRNLNPTVDATEAQKLSSVTFPSLLTNSTGNLWVLQVVSAAAVNTLYAIDDNAGVAGAVGTYGYKDRVLGFKDTLIGVTTQSGPADNAVLKTTDSADLTWTAVDGAKKYEVMYGDKADLSGTIKDPVFLIADTKTTIDADIDQGTTYYWKVRVQTDADDGVMWGRWSTVRSFVTAIESPGVATTKYPPNGATDVSITPTFSWDANGPAGATYEFQIAQGGDINSEANPFLIQDWAATSTVNVLVSRQPLMYSTQYRWRVRAVTASSTSAWTVSEFVTVAAPVVPSTTTTVPPVTTIIVPTQPVATPTVTVINSGTTTQAAQPIPSYLLWAVIAVGAILVIAVIVLIVRTRKI